MLEWLALVLLVPLVLVPVVLLFGFAGCELVFPLVPSFAKIFEITYDQERERKNSCIVVRIEPDRLGDRNGSRVRLTIERPQNGGLHIRALTVSHAADTGNLYDSAETPTLVALDQMVMPDPDPANQLVVLDTVEFNFIHTRPLLIAMDIGDPGHLRTVANVLDTDGKSFRSDAPPFEAETTPRSPGYQTEDRFYLVKHIEV